MHIDVESLIYNVQVILNLTVWFKEIIPVGLKVKVFVELEVEVALGEKLVYVGLFFNLYCVVYTLEILLAPALFIIIVGILQETDAVLVNVLLVDIFNVLELIPTPYTVIDEV